MVRHKNEADEFNQPMLSDVFYFVITYSERSLADE